MSHTENGVTSMYKPTPIETEKEEEEKDIVAKFEKRMMQLGLSVEVKLYEPVGSMPMYFVNQETQKHWGTFKAGVLEGQRIRNEDVENAIVEALKRSTAK